MEWATQVRSEGEIGKDGEGAEQVTRQCDQAGQATGYLGFIGCGFM